SDYLIGLGTLYRAIGDYSNALKNYRQVFQTDTHETIQMRIDNSSETWTRMEFAELFSLEHQYDSAWHYYNLFDTIKITEKDLRIYLVSTGETYLLQKNYKKALPNFLRGLAMHKKLNDRNEIKRVLLDVAKTYLALNDYKQALSYAKEGLDLSLQTKSLQFVRDAYQVLYLLYDQVHKTDSAYYYYQKYNAVKDEVVNDQIKGMFAAYKYQEEINHINNEKLLSQQQLKIQQQQLQQESLQKKILAGSIIALILIGAIIFRTIMLKRKNEKLRLENELQVQNLENQKQLSELELQALRAQMNPHFIFNCLNSINRFIITNEATKAADYLTKFAKLIRIVLEQSGKPFIPLEDELKCLQLYMDLEALRFEKPFQYEINWDGIDTSSVMIPSMLIQPFVENAIWHGLHTKNDSNGKININMNVRDDILYCNICDNGIGRAASIIKEETETGKKSLGINLTEHRLQLIDPLRKEKVGIKIHDLINDSGHNAGTCVDINIPVKTI
ncbi:MAG TPA: histidine kinase, partial [Chitinophagaceae bacterium]|nr:histidine kinase [Chitinophagaceae bacterium]